MTNEIVICMCVLFYMNKIFIFFWVIFVPGDYQVYAEENSGKDNENNVIMAYKIKNGRALPGVCKCRYKCGGACNFGENEAVMWWKGDGWHQAESIT